MLHNRKEVTDRTKKEFKQLDDLVKDLSEEEWAMPVPRPEGKDPWTVKDALAHVTFWKADLARSIRKQRRPKEEQGLGWNEFNHLIYMRWRDRSPREVLGWHRQVQKDLLKALEEAPDEYFTAKNRDAEWPYDLEGHSIYHRKRDIERALEEG